MTNTEKKNFGHTAHSNDDLSEHPEKLEENDTYPHLTQHKPLTIGEFKARLSSDVITDEDVIKAVYDALPDVNSDSLYHNGTRHLKYSPMEFLLHEYQSESPITRKLDEHALLFRDIIQMMDEFDKAPDSNDSVIANYAHALAQSSICYVDAEYGGKENN